MRNIYDIISEQKAIVDVEICSHELRYLTEEFDYLQEGVGNIVKGVIDFIKKIMAKIKEMVDKVVSMIFGSQKSASGIDNELSKINAEKDRKAANPNTKKPDIKPESKPDKKEEPDEPEDWDEDKPKSKPPVTKNEVQTTSKKTPVRFRSKEELLKGSKLPVTVDFLPADLNKKIDLANKFFSAVDSVTQQMVSMKFYDGDILVKTVIERTFRDREKFKGQLVGGESFSGLKDLDILFNLHCGTEKSPMTIMISSISDRLIPYIENGKKTADSLKEKEKKARDNLSKMANMLENAGRGNAPATSDVNINDMTRAVRDLGSLIGNFTYILCKSINNCTKMAFNLAEKAMNDYRSW